MFEFAGFKNGGSDTLIAEQRYKAVTAILLYAGQAMKLSAGRLCTAAVTADLIYAICDCSVTISASVSADYVPRVFPVTREQIWRTTFATAATANVCSACTGIGMSTACATGLNGALIGTSMILYQFTTGGTPASGGSPSSAAWVTFQSLAIR